MIAIASLRVPVAHPSRFVSGDTRSGRCSLAPRYRPASAHVICRTALGEAINAASAGDASKAGLSTAIRNIGWISFWSQFVLSVVSGVVLLFSTGATSGAAQVSPTDALTATGVLTGLIAAFISWGLVRTGRLIAEGKQVKLEFVMAAVLASTRLNLIGLGATILGMQASIGGLVAKTLSSAAGGMAYYNVRAPPPPVAFDVFTVQSGMNSMYVALPSPPCH
mmetsp:Transcript_10069/g.27413  ORF Transcript_10069/g.27413 Transcript_10069/m.27413 type:complete len:222 (-) Transcript_10069:306-971(-)